MNEKVIRELKEEIEKLRQQLLKGGGGGGGGGGEGGGEEAAGLQVILHALALLAVDELALFSKGKGYESDWFHTSDDMPVQQRSPRFKKVPRSKSTTHLDPLSTPSPLRTDPPVPIEKARMEELLTAQQSTWEEKEKLSQQLEDERQNNVNAAIGQVILFILL